MRVGIFTDTYPPHINGVATSVLMLKKSLEAKGHEVFVVTVNNDLLNYNMDDEHILRMPGLPTGIYDYRLTGIYPLRSINIIKNWNLDIIHSHTDFGVGTFARIIAKQLSIPLVHTYHTMYEDYIYYITKGFFDGASKKLASYLTLFFCDKAVSELIVPTKKTYKLFKEKYQVDRNIHIVPTGIDVERFYLENLDQKKILEIKKKMNFKNSDFILTFIGRIAKEKSVEVLIDYHKKLIKKNSKIKLMIIGDGPAMSEMQELINKNKLTNYVILTGKVPWEEVPYYYAISNILVTASKTETQGLTVIEGMAASLPVVAIKDESFEATVIDDLNGYLFKNEDDYIEKIISILKDKKKTNHLKEQAKITAQSYSMKYYAERILDVYNLAIKKNKEKKGHLINKIKKVIGG